MGRKKLTNMFHTERDPFRPPDDRAGMQTVNEARDRIHHNNSL